MKRKTHEEFVSEMKIKHPNIIILSKYKNDKTKVLVKCLIDNYEWYAVPNRLLRGIGCPCCSNRVVVKGINDLWTTHPEIAKLLKNPEDGYKYTYGSNSIVEWECPECHTIKKNKIIEVVNKGISCNACSDNISYPNKLMFNILKNLKCNFESEFSPEWANKKRFDFLLLLNDKKYIIEMDGGLGHGNNIYNNSKLTKEQTKEIDNIKDKLANEHGYIVIRIDATKSDIDYIKNDIIKKLSNIIDVKNINWKYCDFISQKSRMIEACNLYNTTNYTAKEIGKIIGCCDVTVYNYINRGIKLNLCKRKSKGKKVLCITSEIIFDSAEEAAKFYNTNASAIRACCNGKTNHAKNLKFIYLSDFKGDINNLKNNIHIKGKNRNRSVKCYNKDLNFLGIFDTACKAGKNFGVSETGVRYGCEHHNLVHNKYYFLYEDDDIFDDCGNIDKSKIIA